MPPILGCLVCLMKYLAVMAAALALSAPLFFMRSKRRLALKVWFAILAIFGGFALLGALYFGALFVVLGGNPDFLDIDSCLDSGGIWNYTTKTCEH